MKWKAKDAFGLGTSRKNKGQSSSKSSKWTTVMGGNTTHKDASLSLSSSSSLSAAEQPNKRHSAPTAMSAPATNTLRLKRSNSGLYDGLGTIRVGMTRMESAPICTPTPRAKRQLISELLQPDGGDEGNGEDAGGVTASPSLRSIISNRTSSGKSFDKEVGKGDSFSSYTPEEKVAFACHLNAHLLGDRFLKHLLPLDPQGGDLFNKFNDGVLLCRLVCLAIPGSIADSQINVPCESEPLGLYKSTENLNAALTAAEAAGLQVVNIGASDIINGRPASILGLSWQLIRVHLLAQVNLKRCPDLIHLMEDDETKEEFFALPVEDVLLRWFNHHLRWAGSERRVSNFSDDLMDGECYITLLKELNDNFQEPEYPSDEDEKRVRFRRACHVISGAEGLGLAPLIRPRHISQKAHLYNIAFVAQLLNRKPRIHRERLHLPAATSMQAWYRMLRTMRVTTPVIEQRRFAVTTIARSWRQHALSKRQREAATKLQAWRRGITGRNEASILREERRQMEERRAKKEAEKVKREKRRADREKRREAWRVAATKLQARARGMETRRALAIVLAEKGLPPLGSQRLRDAEEPSAPPLTCDPHLTTPQQIGLDVSPRTSVSSSVRLSEDSPGFDDKGCPFGGAASVVVITDGSAGNIPDNVVAAAKDIVTGDGSAGNRQNNSAGANKRRNSGWFDMVFKGMSFSASGSEIRPRVSPRRTEEAIAAKVIQRWRRKVTESRKGRMRAIGEVARRRWAVRRLHEAYARKWRFHLAARTEIRKQLALKEEEEVRKDKEARRVGFDVSKGTRWLNALWNDLLRGVSSAFENKGGDGSGSSSSSREARRKNESGMQGWPGAYLAHLVVGSLRVGEAQEARAKQLARIGSDGRFWRAPENPLSPVNCIVMLGALLAAALDVTISQAAASGA